MKVTVTKYLGFLENEHTTQFDLDDIYDIKVEFMKIINAILEKKSWTQVRAAQILGVKSFKYKKSSHRWLFFITPFWLLV